MKPSERIKPISYVKSHVSEIDWDHEALNQARVDWLQQFDDTKFHARGVIAIDDVLIDKSGNISKESARNERKSSIACSPLLSNDGCIKFCGQSYYAIIPLFVRGGIVRGGDIDFLNANNLFYPNS